MATEYKEYKAFKSCSGCDWNETNGPSDGIVCPSCGLFIDRYISGRYGINDKGETVFDTKAEVKPIP